MLKIFVTMGLKRLIDSVAEVFYPRLCPVCGERLVAGERSVCLSCLAVMPRVGIAQGGCPEVERMLLAAGLWSVRCRCLSIIAPALTLRF